MYTLACKESVTAVEKPHISLHLIHRLADHLESCNTFSLKKIKFLVLDEADRLLAGGGGFDEQVCIGRRRWF